MIQRIKIEDNCLCVWPASGNLGDNYDLIPIKSITYVTAVVRTIDSFEKFTIGITGRQHGIELNTIPFKELTDVDEPNIQQLMNAHQKIQKAVKDYHGGLNIRKPKSFDP